MPVSGDIASGRGPASSDSEASCASAPASVPPVSIPPPSVPPSPASPPSDAPPSVPPSVGAASQRPMASVIDEQTCGFGQPFPPVPRHPGTQRDVVPSHTRPDVAPPQSASVAQPQRPSVRHWLPASSGLHCGLLAAPGTHSSHFFFVGSQTSGASQSVSKRHWTQCPSGPLLRSQWVSGARQSASLWHIAPEHWPTPFTMSRQVWPVGQPLRGDGPQPGTQSPPTPLQIRPESAAPQDRSSDGPAQPQTPRSETQTGFTPPHRTAFVVVHSVQAPCNGPERWQAGRSGSAQLGAPSVTQGTQARVVVEQTGVTPLQWLSFRHATQTPGPFEVSQRGVAAAQWVTSVAVHAAQAPVGRQIGVAGPHSASDAQARHMRADPSHTGFVPPHSPFVRHPTHVADTVSQTGVAPVQRVALVAEHWPHAPDAWQAGAMPPQSSSAAQPRQLCRLGSHTGFVPMQTVLSRHSTHTPTGV